MTTTEKGKTTSTTRVKKETTLTTRKNMIDLIDNIQKLADDIRNEQDINKSFSYKVFKHIMSLLFNNECVDYEVFFKFYCSKNVIGIGENEC